MNFNSSLKIINTINIPEISRYVIAGSFAFTVDVLTLYVFTEFFGFHYLVSNIVGYLFGLVVAFLLNTKWVFSIRKYNRVDLEFSIFLSIAGAGLLLSEFLMWEMVEQHELSYLYAKIIATGFVFMFNYLMRKILLFSK